ncbi:MAG: BREX-1 system adenine-specific DNA-methyltransferase PglX [Thermoanaerobaculaceae bacterium]
MDKQTRNLIANATQAARRLLEGELAQQLEGVYDVLPNGTVAEGGGSHLGPAERLVRDKIAAVLAHKQAGGKSPAEAVEDYIREAAFTCLNRFVALKMLEARELVRECVSRGETSSGFKEFCGLASGLASLPDKGYRLFIESLFDELSTEIKVLFDRHDPASLLWPRRQALTDLIDILNASELAAVWGEDETIGWVYQYFNSGDERKKMREESQAPRNSRELAVRNQFFTPRYVVQFLTDNTLGRIWYEMRQGDTALVDRCAYLVRDQEAVAERPKKDPRDIRLLDPAGGSGHFLLYAFDLFLVIYEEAWNDQGSPKSKATGRTLREDYPDLGVLRRALPALILKHNLNAVDIDPRCVQIAALALWMRAQRAYKDLGLSANERAPITRIHVVVAEPMPGDAAMVDSFAASLEPPLLGALFKKMVGEMRLAGELGTLLRVEDGIATELKRAREQFVARETLLRTGFLPGMEPPYRQGDLDLSGIDDGAFFHQAEARIDEALRRFAEAVAGGAGVRRQLFAGDAAQGVALIDLLQTRFDVVLMNPPFGAGSLAAKKEYERSYPRSKNDLLAAFVERGIQLLHERGMLGAITSRTGFFLASYQEWREDVVLKEASPTLFADLGQGVLDGAVVEVAAYTMRARRSGTQSPRAFAAFRLLTATDKGAALLEATRAIAGGHPTPCTFSASVDDLGRIPGSPLAYWVTASIQEVFRNFPPFDNEKAGRATRCGLGTLDDFRFLRLMWEVSNRRDVWSNYYHGGVFSPFYDQFPLLVRWQGSGREVKAFVTQKVGSASRKVQGEDKYFQPGFVFPRRTKALAPKVMSRNGIFSTGGQAGFAPDNEILASIGLLSSRICSYLISLTQGRTGDAAQFEVGLIKRVPWPYDVSDAATLAAPVRRAWSLKRSLDTHVETSHAFSLPALLQVKANGIAQRFAAWCVHEGDIAAELAGIQATIDNRCFDFYSINQADRRAIIEGSEKTSGDASQGSVAETASDAEDLGNDDEDSSVDQVGLVAELVSWTVGVAVGRFDVRLATGDRPLPQEPDPFDPLPVCSPGMLIGNDGLPLLAAPAGYPLKVSEGGLLIDDPGHARDLTVAVRAVFDVVFGVDADTRWSEAVGLLDPNGNGLRNWLATGFFEHHIKCYSKSRRRAPIYWQLATPSATYSVWLYLHRLSGDSLFQVLNDLVAPKLAHEERQLMTLAQRSGGSLTASQRKEIAGQEVLVDELRAFRDEVARVAPLWNPDLDDGVIINFAPLWRLVPQYKVWQRECKACWDKLVVGEYDWAHLAMHLWPERVVPKCASDRSLAIAHRLEQEFWEEDEGGKWQQRRMSQARVEELVRERTSPAVKAALQSLLDTPSAPSGRGLRTPRRPALAQLTARPARPAPEPTEGVRVARGPAASDETLRAVRDAIAASPGGASRAEVVASTGVLATEWNAAISALLERGEVVRTGEKRGTRYFLKGGLSA